jgi:hypothetical protein
MKRRSFLRAAYVEVLGGLLCPLKNTFAGRDFLRWLFTLDEHSKWLSEYFLSVTFIKFSSSDFRLARRRNDD